MPDNWDWYPAASANVTTWITSGLATGCSSTPWVYATPGSVTVNSYMLCHQQDDVIYRQVLAELGSQAAGNINVVELYDQAMSAAVEPDRQALIPIQRAERLLMSMLTDEQRRDWEAQKQFEVTVSGRRYRLTNQWAGNVFRLDASGDPEYMFCIHPETDVPVADSLIVQKLMLETNEREFLRIANRSRPRRGSGRIFGWEPIAREIAGPARATAADLV